jgi:hypothetical protein
MYRQVSYLKQLRKIFTKKRSCYVETGKYVAGKSPPQYRHPAASALFPDLLIAGSCCAT